VRNLPIPYPEGLRRKMLKSGEKFSSIADAIISPARSTESEKLFVSRSCPGVLGV